MFSSNKSEGKSAVQSVQEIDRITELENKLKYHGYSPEARAIIEENDKRDAAQEQGRQSHAKRAAQEAIIRKNFRRTTALRLLENGNLKIVVGEKRVTTLSEDLCIPCPDCGTALRDSGIIVDRLTEKWIKADGKSEDMVIRDCQGPLSIFVGLPFVETPLRCTACGNAFKSKFQMSVI